MGVDTAAMAAAEAAITASIAAHQALLEPDRLAALVAAAEVVRDCLSAGGQLLIFGNGGSASDAAHIAAEFVGRFQRERRGYPAVALGDNASAVTAIANDYGFERVFARQVEALGRPGDVAVAISTSGRSPNVVAGAVAARDAGLRTIALTGAQPCPLSDIADVCLHAPAAVTARVQEGHILMAHVICDLVERDL